MIKKEENLVRYAQLIDELCDAKNHLEAFINNLDNDDYTEDCLKTDLGHIYAHLNRFTNSRNSLENINENNWDVFSQFPSDIKPVG